MYCVIEWDINIINGNVCWTNVEYSREQWSACLRNISKSQSYCIESNINTEHSTAQHSELIESGIKRALNLSRTQPLNIHRSIAAFKLKHCKIPCASFIVCFVFAFWSAYVYICRYMYLKLIASLSIAVYFTVVSYWCACAKASRKCNSQTAVAKARSIEIA